MTVHVQFNTPCFCYQPFSSSFLLFVLCSYSWHDIEFLLTKQSPLFSGRLRNNCVDVLIAFLSFPQRKHLLNFPQDSFLFLKFEKFYILCRKAINTKVSKKLLLFDFVCIFFPFVSDVDINSTTKHSFPIHLNFCSRRCRFPL